MVYHIWFQTCFLSTKNSPKNIEMSSVRYLIHCCRQLHLKIFENIFIFITSITRWFHTASECHIGRVSIKSSSKATSYIQNQTISFIPSTKLNYNNFNFCASRFIMQDSVRNCQIVQISWDSIARLQHLIQQFALEIWNRINTCRPGV